MGYWSPRADETLDNPPSPPAFSGQDELKDPGKIGVNKSVDCDTFPFSVLTLSVWRQKGVALLVVTI